MPLAALPQPERELLEQLRGVSADVSGALDAATREAREESLRAQITRLEGQRTLLGQAGRALAS